MIIAFYSRHCKQLFLPQLYPEFLTILSLGLPSEVSEAQHNIH